MGAGPPQAQGGFFPPPPRGSSARPPPPPAAASANKPRVAPPPPAFGGMRAPPPPARTASPLGPGRVGSPSNAPRMPSANMAAARPPPPPSSSSSAYAPPPGSAQSPPPGRGPAGQSRPPAPPASVAAPAPPPVAPKHPAGDRSHIPEEDLPIFEQIQFLFDYIKTLPPPNVRFSYSAIILLLVHTLANLNSASPNSYLSASNCSRAYEGPGEAQHPLRQAQQRGGLGRSAQKAQEHCEEHGEPTVGRSFPFPFVSFPFLSRRIELDAYEVLHSFLSSPQRHHEHAIQWRAARLGKFPRPSSPTSFQRLTFISVFLLDRPQAPHPARHVASSVIAA
jgi:hypothetical protein